MFLWDCFLCLQKQLISQQTKLQVSPTQLNNSIKSAIVCKPALSIQGKQLELETIKCLSHLLEIS